jgi:hypothetical protein
MRELFGQARYLLHQSSNLIPEALLLFFQGGGPSFEHHGAFLF